MGTTTRYRERLPRKLGFWARVSRRALKVREENEASCANGGSRPHRAIRSARSTSPLRRSIDSVTTWIGAVGGMFQRLRSCGSARSTAPRSSTTGSISRKNAKRPHISVVLRAVLVVRGDGGHPVARGEPGVLAGVGLGVVMEVLQADVAALVDDLLLLRLGLLRPGGVAHRQGEGILGGL